MSGLTIDELTLADDPDNWRALGFSVEANVCQLGAVRLRFAMPDGGNNAPRRVNGEDGSVSAAAPHRGIVGWSLRGLASTELDGLPTSSSERPPPEGSVEHANGALAVDHVVAFSPAFERSVRALRDAGLDLRRIRDEPTPAGAPRQAFFRLGAEILELVQEPAEAVARLGGPDHAARFWGLAVLVQDIDRATELMAPHASEPRAAVQPGRRIATVRRSARLTVPLALMSRGASEDAARA